MRAFFYALLLLLPAVSQARPDSTLTKAPCQGIVAAAPWASLTSRGNTRYAAERFPVHRPSLTFNGFDNTKDGLNANAGHGLRQALMEVFGTTRTHMSGALT